MQFTVVELATPENFDEFAYLKANPDVAKAGLLGRDHFQQFGRTEGRLQYNSEFLKAEKDYRKAKFALFSPALQRELLQSYDTFPIVVGSEHFNLDQYVAESANPGFGPFNDEVASNPNKLYLDLGCGFRSSVYRNCLYLEVYPSSVADLIVEPTCFYPIESGSLDGIGCFAVLEHTRKPWLVVQEMKRMLKKGGKVYIDWPFLQPIHGFPSHFFNATREGLRSLFEDNDFKVEYCITGAHQTPAYTVNWIARELAREIPEGSDKDELLDLTLREIASMPPRSELWLKIMSLLQDSAMSQFACGNCLVAAKV